MGHGAPPTLLGELAETALFRDIGEEGLSAACAGASRFTLRNGTVLVNQGDPPTHLFLLKRGRLKMSVVTPEGAQLTLRFMHNGDIIGCAAVFRGMAYPASATAVEDATGLSWTAGQIGDLVSRFPKLAANALAIVSDRADEFLQRLRETATEKVEQRIARALLRMSLTGQAASSALRIAVSRQQLAEMANTSLYTCSRVVSGWSREGIVRAGRGQIWICDAARLRRLAAGAA